jgi:pimeloyl-ACP methyl ester carboxylesterase
MLWILLAILLAGAAWGLHYGYKTAFYYDDPRKSPYEYGNNEQILRCKEILDAAIEKYDSASCEAVSITSHDGLTLTGKYYHIADGAPLEIYCHGYKGNAIRDFCGFWPVAKELGHNVLLIDQRSHGDSQGHTISFGILEKQDVQNWVRWAEKRFGPVNMALCGVSMGAATVLMASGMENLPKCVKAIVADCPFDAPSNIIKKVLGQDMGLPVKVVYPLILAGGKVYGKFNLNADSPVEAVKRATMPILLIHGDDDRFVPHAMSQNIHAAAPEKIDFHTIPGAGHALDAFAAPERFQGIVKEFLKKYL